jgi:hypothetical protein
MSDREIKKVVFRKGPFHGLEFTATSFDGDNPIVEFITLPAFYSKDKTIECWAETYRWLGTKDDQCRLIYGHISSKFVKLKQNLFRQSQESEITESAEATQ